MSGGGKLGVWQLFGAAIGVIVAQISMISLTQGVGIGGWGFLVAMTLAFLIACANAMAYAEMALMMPSAGSLSRYAEVALGDFPAILLVFAGYIAPAIFGLPAELILADRILSASIPLHVPAFTWPVLIVVVFTALNIFGTDLFARVQTALSFMVLIFLVTTGLVALSGHAASPAFNNAQEGFSNLAHSPSILSMVALAFWVFVGSEFVTPLVPEASNANRDLPKAMVGGLITIFIAQILFALGSAFVLPREQVVFSVTPHWDYAIATYGPSARIWFAALALIATASLINTVVASIPRMLWGMAQNGQVFPIFKYLHPRFKTPIVGILFVGCLPLVGLWWTHGDAQSILPQMVAASVAWLLAYVLAQVSLVILRRRYPNAPRAFRMPGSPVIPVLAILGMLYVIAHSAPTPEMAPQIAKYAIAVLALFALVGAVWVKFVMHRRLFQPRPLDAARGAA